FGLMVAFGSPLPIWDEWVLAPAWSGQQPITPGWLVAWHCDHRLPLPKLIMTVLGRLSRGDCRPGMVVNIVMLSGLAAAMMVAAKRLRGRFSFADALFPIALLNWGL